jgi:hypothetical protein
VADFLPSKKIILVLTLLTVLGGGFWVYKSTVRHNLELVYDPRAAGSGAVAGSSDANLDSEQASLAISSNASCCIIEEPGESPFKFIVMPMRL